MKLLHTADWHIGQTFFDFDRKREHDIFFRWLKELIKNEEIDTLLIAGDIFDSPNPSADSQRVYYKFLKEVTSESPDLQIIIIAGNHDSAARLEAPNPLLEEMNVSVRGVVKRDALGEIDYEHLIVPLKKGGYCLAVPYLRQGDYPIADTYAQGVQSMYKELLSRVEGKGRPIIAMGHLHVMGSELSMNDRSERVSVIGGVELISAETFKTAIDYTALGHLHRSQRVASCEHIRYAGAPLPMSFAERNNKQGVNIIEIGERTDIRKIEFDAPVKLLSIPSSPKILAEVLEELSSLPDGEITDNSPFLEIKVLITEPEPSMRHQIEERIKGKSVKLTRIAAETSKLERERKPMTYDDLQKLDPMDIAIDYYKQKYEAEMPEHIKEMLNNVIKEVEG